MKRNVRILLTSALVVLALVLAFASVQAATTSVTVTLLDHNGNPLAGGALEGYWSGGWHGCAGTTNGSGTLTCSTVDASYTKLRMMYNYTAIEQDLAGLALTNNTWKTTQVVIELRDSANNLILAANDTSGGNVLMGSPNGGWAGKGWTGTDGKFEVEVFPTNPGGTPPWFKVDYRQGTMQRNDVPITAIPVTPPIVFQTAKVTLFHSGQINIDKGGGGLYPFTKPSTELFPATWKFKFSNLASADIVVTSAGVSKFVNLLVLKDSTGAAINGNTSGRGGYGASFGTWFVSGPTVNNVTFDIRDSATQPGQMSYEKTVNSTTQVKGPQDVAVNSIFTFQTRLLTLRLETCALAPLNGGTARWGNGASFGTYFFPAPNSTGSGAAGETAAQFFPGTYSFEMNYQGTAEVKPSVVIPDADTKLTWQTTKVTLNYSAELAYGGGSGDSAFFTKPSMELMPGTVWFNFRGGAGGHPGRTQLTLPACTFEKTVAKLIVNQSNGTTGVPDVSFVWQIVGSPPDQAVPNQTDANGVALHFFDGYNNSQTRYLPRYENVVGPRKDPLPATQSLVEWKLINVTVQLTDVSNNPISGASPLVTYEHPGPSVRTNFGNLVNGTLSKEMMPIASGFVAFFIDNYNNTNGRINASPFNASPTTVTFQTGQIAQGTTGDAPGYIDHFRRSGGANNGNPGAGMWVLPNTFYIYHNAGESARLVLPIAAGQTLTVNSDGNYAYTP